MKGQVFETLSFLILAISIIGIIILMRIYLVGGFSRTFINLAERHESERTRAGVDALLATTEEKTGKTELELIGISAYVGNSSIFFGPTIGSVDIKKDLTWRFDAEFGKGHWYIKVPYPDIVPDVQIVMVEDASSSMCFSIETLSKKLPQLIDQMRENGKKVTFTLYMLPGAVQCCSGYTIACTPSQFPEKEYFHCRGIETIQEDCTTKLPSGMSVQTDEDYGDGLACAIEAGPVEKWKTGSIKIAIGSSDELSIGSECGGTDGCCPPLSNYHAALDSGNNAINASLEKQVPLFMIQAIDWEDQARTKCGTACIYEGGGTMNAALNDPQCACTDLVTEFQKNLASSTGGQFYTLSSISAQDVTDKIQDIINKQKQNRLPELEVGTQIPVGKDIRAVTIPIPVSLAGIYTTAYIYEWS
jgi:hypothetical protein